MPFHDQNLARFRAIHAAGVKFMAGTDAGWRYTPIAGLPLEIELMPVQPRAPELNGMEGSGLAIKYAA